MTSDALGRILGQLEQRGLRVRKIQRGYIAQCPAHDDHNPSLGITPNDRGVRLHCFTGCDFRDVVGALGLQPADVFDEPLQQRGWLPRPEYFKSIAEKTYHYTNETGDLLYQKLRLPGKSPGEKRTFRILRPDRQGGWILGLDDDTRRVLYNLPAVLEAVAADRTIWILEGEKDVDRAAELGIVATTNFDGAGSWRSEYAEVFRGARVVVIADNDPPGIAHAWTVVAALEGIAAAVTAVCGAVDELGADLSDHLDAGYGLEDLRPLSEAAYLPEPDYPPDWEPERDSPSPKGTAKGQQDQGSDLGKGQKGPGGQGYQGPRPRRTRWRADELMAEDFAAPRYAVQDVIPEGLSLLAGAPKIGKSWLALDLAVAVASGGRALGEIDVIEGDVLYLALEDTGRRLQSRLKKVLGPNSPPKRLTLETECGPFPTAAAVICEWLDENPDARLVVIDVFAKIRGRVPPSTPQYDADYAAISYAKRIADDYGVAVLLVHHVRKATSEDFLADVSGTNGIAGAADAVLVLKRSRGDADGALHVTGRDVDESEYALRFNAEHGHWTAIPGPAIDHLLGDTRMLILGYLRRNPGAHGPKTIGLGIGASYDLTKQTLRRMAEADQVTRNGRGQYMVVPPVTPVTSVPSAGQSDDQAVPSVSPSLFAVPSDGDEHDGGDEHDDDGDDYP